MRERERAKRLSEAKVAYEKNEQITSLFIPSAQEKVFCDAFSMHPTNVCYTSIFHATHFSPDIQKVETV